MIVSSVIIPGVIVEEVNLLVWDERAGEDDRDDQVITHFSNISYSCTRSLKPQVDISGIEKFVRSALSHPPHRGMSSWYSQRTFLLAFLNSLIVSALSSQVRLRR